jgi:hypothetical protein
MLILGALEFPNLELLYTPLGFIDSGTLYLLGAGANSFENPSFGLEVGVYWSALASC